MGRINLRLSICHRCVDHPWGRVVLSSMTEWAVRIEGQNRMEWKNLLNANRIRYLFEGENGNSIRSDVETRDEFERDYGRVLYSAPVRRLRDKAQVFPLEHHDSVRTRLAHSLEVSSVARSLGRSIGRWLLDRPQPPIQPDDVSKIENVAATCGLVHDLGNPPFGHAGELAIQTWFSERVKGNPKFLDGLKDKERADFEKFEGNAQTLRLVSHLQVLADSYGMNLTAGTLSALCKYLPPAHLSDKNGPHIRKKPGYFLSEAEVVKLVRSHTGTGDARNPITFLVEAADDMVYTTVDLEDGVKKRVLDWPEIEERMRKTTLGAKALEYAHRKIDPAKLPKFEHREAMAQAFRTFAIGEMAAAVFATFRERYTLIMDGQYSQELIYDEGCAAAALARESKAILKADLYTSPQILALEVRGRRVLHDLMSAYWEAAEVCSDAGSRPDSYSSKLYRLISDNYRRVFETRLKDQERSHSESYYRLQLVTDQVAGMTDTHACRIHKDLSNGN